VAVPALELSFPTEAPEQAPAVPESGPFVTETMAELYLQQGHRDEALRVYRALLDQRPDDASLRAKVANLETPLAPRAAVQPIQPQPAERVGPSGPTIREVLNLVAMRRPGFRPSPLLGNGGPESTAPGGEISAAAPDAIGAFLGAPQISAEDEHAAVTLALAFVAPNGTEPASARAAESREIVGAPARPAATELSLDTVFGGGGAGSPPAPSSFSFDQFFSQRAAAEGPAAAAPAGASSAESPSDVAQFTQWLEGLKQR
jgi:hypothetical protein